MKCISLWQPWASALFILDREGLPIKRDETRGWYTHVRGRIAIHASQHKMPRKLAAPYITVLNRYGIDWDSLPFGALLGTTELTQIRTGPEAALLRTAEQRFWGDYRKYGDDGKPRYALEMVKPAMLAAPIPFRGSRKFFEVPDEFFAASGIGPCVEDPVLPLEPPLLRRDAR